jgi:cytochrome c553
MQRVPNAVMGPFAAKLSEQDMLDLAAYYSYLPHQPGIPSRPAAALPQIVARGAPMRNVPACSSCHGTTDANLGTPWLDGQSDVYIKAQLQAFTTGARRNDISEQTRNIARKTRHLVLLVAAAHELDHHFIHGGFKFVRYSVFVHQFEDCGHRFAVALDRARNKDLKNDLLFRKNFRYSVFRYRCRLVKGILQKLAWSLLFTRTAFRIS